MNSHLIQQSNLLQQLTLQTSLYFVLVGQLLEQYIQKPTILYLRHDTLLRMLWILIELVQFLERPHRKRGFYSCGWRTGTEGVLAERWGCGSGLHLEQGVVLCGGVWIWAQLGRFEKGRCLHEGWGCEGVEAGVRGCWDIVRWGAAGDWWVSMLKKVCASRDVYGSSWPVCCFSKNSFLLSQSWTWFLC